MCFRHQDYYALYKVFKKSGPGPKNGEQYGAPFKEEDWADDEYPCVNGMVAPEIPVVQHNEVSHVDNVRVSDQLEPLLDDFEEIIKQIAEEPAPNQLLKNDYLLSQVCVIVIALMFLPFLFTSTGPNQTDCCDLSFFVSCHKIGLHRFLCPKQVLNGPSDLFIA